MNKKRNPIAKAVKQLRPRIKLDERDKTMRKKDIEEMYAELEYPQIVFLDNEE